ncbi:DsbC family protein [Tepidiphilus sp. J10]|jgi:thiol:disulfide interchange protein DsbC|uniref:DsbC family protein n=1 Tax=Tepidiphilus sp. J10 TaxID=2502185 RepID=UPI00115DB754|nr:DsbC family protein [Tepidiphilus sp. J10]
MHQPSRKIAPPLVLAWVLALVLTGWIEAHAGDEPWSDLDEGRRDGMDVGRVDFARLPFDRAIALVYGTGSRTIVSFADPNCGYCKESMRELDALGDVTVYLFLYPILGEDSREKSERIWCAPDRAQAWRAWMLEGRLPAPAACDASAIEENLRLGRELRISWVPTIILPSGKRISGLIRADDLGDLLTGEASGLRR